MAAEFQSVNSAATRKAFAGALRGAKVVHEPHPVFKKRVPAAVGLIRTGDTTQYANVVLISG